MSDTDRPSPRGPLDELVPGLRAPDARFSLSEVHPRALELPLGAGGHALVLCVWKAPASASALHAQLRPLIEAALLAELSRPVSQLREHPQDWRALMLITFEPFAFDPMPALAPFALSQASLASPDARAAAALWRREGQRVDGEVGDEPVALYSAALAQSKDARVQSAIAHTLAAAPEDAWGSHPGRLARGLADALSTQGLAGVEPTHAGLARLEQLLVPDVSDAVRWLPPIAFQALCDLLAIAAHSWGMQVRWGVCEPDEDTGLAPPPVIHVQRGSTSGHVPLGEHVLRWCIMPRRADETIPPLADWAQHEFAG